MAECIMVALRTRPKCIKFVPTKKALRPGPDGVDEEWMVARASDLLARPMAATRLPMSNPFGDSLILERIVKVLARAR